MIISNKKKMIVKVITKTIVRMALYVVLTLGVALPVLIAATGVLNA